MPQLTVDESKVRSSVKKRSSVVNEQHCDWSELLGVSNRMVTFSGRISAVKN